MKAEGKQEEVRFRHAQRDPTSDRSSSSNMAAGRFSSPGRAMRFMSATSSLTTSWKRRRSARASVLRPSPAPCAIFFRSDGCIPRKPMSARIRSAFTICRWNFSSAARWQTMSRTFCSIPSRTKSSSKRTSIGSSCSNRSPTRVWAMEVSDAWRLASSIPWPRCKSRRWVMACATNTASSNRPSRTAGNRNCRTTGFVVLTHGKSRVRTRRWM